MLFDCLCVCLSAIQLPDDIVKLLFPCSGIHVDSPPIIPTLTTSYGHGVSTTSFLYSTIGETLQNTTERFPDREAMTFVEDGVRKTFAQFQEDVSHFLKVYCSQVRKTSI